MTHPPYGRARAQHTWSREVVPDDVVLVVADPSLEPEPLFPEEEPAIARAVEKRRREFRLGRTCARHALARLGAPAVAIPVSSDRRPLWPDGVVGSITHTESFVAAAVAWREAYVSIGLDAEQIGPLEPRIVEMVATPAEREHIDAVIEAQPHLPKLVFSAKECIHKVVSPMAGITLGFHDVEIDFDLAGRRFSARLVRPGDVEGLELVRGRFLVTSKLVITAATIAARAT